MASTQGDAEVTVMLGDGHRANLSVKLIPIWLGDGAKVYGTITAGQIKIFEKKREEAIPINKWRCVDVINLPSNSTTFEFTVNLMVINGTDSPDHELANGSVIFEVKSAGNTEKLSVDGQYGSVEVNVVWG